MNKRITTSITGLALIFIFSCSSGLKLQFQKPATYELTGIKILSIAPCGDTEEGMLIGSYLKSLLENTNYFTLFDKNSFIMALRQNDLTYQQIARIDSIGKFGRQLNAEGIIFTDIKYLNILPDENGIDKVEDVVWTGEYERDENNKIIEELDENGIKAKKKKFKSQLVNRHYNIRKAEIVVNFRLMNLQNSKEVFSGEIIEHYQSEKILTSHPQN